MYKLKKPRCRQKNFLAQIGHCQEKKQKIIKGDKILVEKNWKIGLDKGETKVLFWHLWLF